MQEWSSLAYGIRLESGRRLITVRGFKSYLLRQYPGVVQLTRTRDLGSRGREFESHHSDHLALGARICITPFLYTRLNTANKYVNILVGNIWVMLILLRSISFTREPRNMEPLGKPF